LRGTIVEKNLKKLRLTVDQLEMQLRQNNITKISDVKWATLEPNGQLGYILNEDAQAATKKEIQTLRADIQEIKQLINTKLPNIKLLTQMTKTNDQLLQSAEQLVESANHLIKQDSQEDIFREVSDKSHKNPPPKHLQ
jgi:uncharacterized membrane protein YcaP (DUF421 family)